MRRTVVTLLVVTTLGTGVAGCDVVTHTEKASRDRVDARPLTDAEQLRVADAQQRLIRDCMKDKGFPYWEAQRLSLEESRSLGYVSDDVVWAREHGYGSRIQAKETRARAANPNAAYRASLPEAHRKSYDAALDEGVEAPVMTATLPSGGTVRKQVGGCVARAERQLYGDPVTWFRAEKTVGGLQQLYVPQVMADKQFARALRAWARCMAAAGHPYKDPAEARRAGLRAALDQAAGRTSDLERKAFGEERAIAVADAGCARDTSLRSIGNARETHYANQLRDRYGDALDTYAQLQRRALARAAKVVEPRT